MVSEMQRMTDSAEKNAESAEGLSASHETAVKAQSERAAEPSANENSEQPRVRKEPPKPAPEPTRAMFYKVGALQYISHLDLVRTMTRIITRAGIPAWFTQGFNPRLKLTFAMPLSIGTQSEREFFDIRLTEPMPKEEIISRLNDCLTDEMRIVDVYKSERKFSEIAWAEYEIRMTCPRFTDGDAERLIELYTRPLVVMKRSKAGDHDVDISPFIRLKSVTHEGGSLVVKALLSADNANYLNPEHLVRCAEKCLGTAFDDPFTECYSILRKEVYLTDGVTVFR